MNSKPSLMRQLVTVWNSTQETTPRYARTPEEIQNMLLAESVVSSAGASVTDATAMRVAAFWACVRLLSETVGTLAANLYERDGERLEIAAGHPVDDLLSIAPNDTQTPFEFFRILMVHLLLRGNFYGQKVIVAGKLIAVLPLNPDKMSVVRAENGALSYEYQVDSGRKVVFKAAQIFHVRTLSVDGIVGLSVLSVARNALGLAIQTEKHGAKLFKNGAVVTGVLKHPATLSDEAVKRLRDQIEERVAGSENAHKPLILEEGLDWQNLGMNAQDTQFIESRKFSRSEIAMFFGVPPHAIGDIERGTSWGSGIEQQNLGFLVYTLQPYLTNISQAVRRDLIEAKERAKYIAKFDTAILTRADFVNRQRGLEIQRKNGVINRNEWRKVEGYSPIKDPQADDYAVDAAPAQQQIGADQSESEAPAALR